MALRKALPALLLGAALLLNPSCVQYYPAVAAPQPQPPASPVPHEGNPDAQPAAQGVVPAPRPPSAIDRLVGPIALYPDPLLALILPASTVPADVSAASAYLVQYGDMTKVDSEPWDPSVRALAHYPTVISWMAQNIEWTRALGSAFLSSPAEVMESVQRLRAQAMAAGALASTPQQQVVLGDNGIDILPAEPDWIYAPSYDTDVVYSDEPYFGYGGPFMNFGAALAVGPWLSYCLDWSSSSVWVGGWRAWRESGRWHRPHFDRGHAPPGARPWHPQDRGPGFPPPERGRHGDHVPLPHPLIGAPKPPPSHFKSPGARAGAPGSGVPVPRTAAPPMERPGSERTVEPARNESHAPEARPRYAPAEGAQTGVRNAQVQESAPASERAQSAAPAYHSEPARESAPAPSRASAPAVSHESSPASAHASAPASAPAAGSRNH